MSSKFFNHTGSIDVITGCMFSGKTTELIRRITTYKKEGKNTIIFKPAIDVRFHTENIVSHDGNTMPCIPITYSRQILEHNSTSGIIGIDEAQFLDDEITTVCHTLVAQGKVVIIAGLDMDFKANPFGPMAELLNMANSITRLRALCIVCNKPASHTFKKTSSSQIIEIGETDIYEARCFDCFEKGYKNSVLTND